MQRAGLSSLLLRDLIRRGYGRANVLGVFIMVNHFDIFGDFGNDTESFLDSFDNESDARAFARVRAGDPDCDYQAISVLEFDGSWLVNVVAEYQARGFCHA